jgi:hypothetical protein
MHGVIAKDGGPRWGRMDEDLEGKVDALRNQ